MAKGGTPEVIELSSESEDECGGKSAPAAKASKVAEVDTTDDSTSDGSPELVESMDPLLDEDGAVDGAVDGGQKESRLTVQKILTLCRPKLSEGELSKLTKKVWKHYELAQLSHTSSKGFLALLGTLVDKIKNEPGNVFLHLKVLVDDLRSWEANTKGTRPRLLPDRSTDSLAGSSSSSSSSISSKASNQQNEEDAKAPAKKAASERQVRKLERLMEALHEKIKKLQEKEINWDEDNQSTYIEEERYKKRFMKVWNKYCEVTGRSKKTGRHIEKKIHFTATRYPEINRDMEALVKRRHFPDFADVYNLVKACNEKEHLMLPPDRQKLVAEEAFECIGRELQHRRKVDFTDLFGCFLTDTEDWRSNKPWEKDSELLQKLEENEKLSKDKEQDILNYYAQKQAELKLEPTDVPDDENSNESKDRKRPESESEECEEDGDSEKDLESDNNGLKQNGEEGSRVASPQNVSEDSQLPEIVNLEEEYSEFIRENPSANNGESSGEESEDSSSETDPDEESLVESGSTAPLVTDVESKTESVSTPVKRKLSTPAIEDVSKRANVTKDPLDV